MKRNMFSDFNGFACFLPLEYEKWFLECCVCVGAHMVVTI
jgi:hypothetical protein